MIKERKKKAADRRQVPVTGRIFYTPGETELKDMTENGQNSNRKERRPGAMEEMGRGGFLGLGPVGGTVGGGMTDAGKRRKDGPCEIQRRREDAKEERVQAAVNG